MFEFEKIFDNIFLFKGGVNNGIIISNGKALLIDCCDMLPGELNSHLGVSGVDMILITQHRRPNTCGIYKWTGTVTKILVPKDEKYLFDNVETYWEDPKNRWHIYHHQPSTQILPKSLQNVSAVKGDDVIEWEGYKITVLDTPGATDGSVSYLLQKDELNLCFCGDLIFGEGKIWELYSLQKGHHLMDYHGFMGNWKKLCISMMKIMELKPEMLIPSHGGVINYPEKHVNLLIKRLDSLYENYSSISSVNYYFPNYLESGESSDEWMKPAVTMDLPGFVKPIGFTSCIITSKTGAGFLIDCGKSDIVENLMKWLDSGSLRTVDACWLTHYHDDHVDAVGLLEKTFNCPIFTSNVMQDILEHPDRYFLPCISPASAKIMGLKHGYRWDWNEFTLTALHFPGQSLYHGGLLVEGYGVKVLFAGDSFSPFGIDDYCCGNRNFSGINRGFRYCINLIRSIQPDYIINQHQEKAFRFSYEELDRLEKTLIQREKLLSDILPWENPNFGTDEWWVRTYPYHQKVPAGSDAIIHVFFTNHGDKSARADAEPVMPSGWKVNKKSDKDGVDVPQVICSCVDGLLHNEDVGIQFILTIPENTEGKQFVIPFRIYWAGRYLGQIRHAIVQVE